MAVKTTVGSVLDSYRKYFLRSPLYSALLHGSLGAGAAGLLAPYILRRLLPFPIHKERGRALGSIAGGLAGVAPFLPWIITNIRNYGLEGLLSGAPYPHERKGTEDAVPIAGAES